VSPALLLSAAVSSTGAGGGGFAQIMGLVIGGILINNYVLSRFLGICPFLGVSKQLDSAIGMGAAVVFVMAMTGAACWALWELVLIPMHLEYLSTIVFILIIAALVQLVEMILLKYSPALYKALGIYLPLITTNCAVLGVAVLNKDAGYNLAMSVINAVSGALGFGLALILMAGLRMRMEYSDIPLALRGKPITFILAGLMSIAFLGFAGLGV
jgi:Na+-translocating ferredoxin:NAD+ oxidoreductase subunit A